MLYTILIFFNCFKFSLQALWVHSTDLSAQVSPSTGQIIALNSSFGLSWGLEASTLAGEPDQHPPVPFNVNVTPCIYGSLPAVCTDSDWSVVGQRSDASCCQTYQIRVSQVLWALEALPGVPSSLGLSTNFSSQAPLPWRTELALRINFSSAFPSSDRGYWAPRGGDDFSNEAGQWEDVLRLLRDSDNVSLQNMQYGQNMLCDATARPPCMGQLLPVPLAFSADMDVNVGLGVVAALDDPIFGLRLDLNASSLHFRRTFNRMAAATEKGGWASVPATYFFVPTPGPDWRPLFSWGRAAFPRFFLAPTLIAGTLGENFTVTSAVHSPGVLERVGLERLRAPSPLSPPPQALLTGLGMYSCANVGDMNLSEARDLSGANLNWDAHFWWPYIGMYLPPISPSGASWLTNLGSGEEPHCGPNFHHGQLSNKSTILEEYRASAAAGIKLLAYFNLNEWGEDFQCNLPPPVSPPPPNDWVNSTEFLANHMADSVLPGCPGTGWQGGVVLDSTVPSFASYLLSQVALKMESFGDAFQGLAFDRFDHATTWRHFPAPGLDDGLAWCGDYCYCLLPGFVRLLTRIGQTMYQGTPLSGRLSTANYVGTLRVDTLQAS